MFYSIKVVTLVENFTICILVRESLLWSFSVRLVNGRHIKEGRLEVFHEGRWGTVCDDSFNKISAGVACKMLNFPR